MEINQLTNKLFYLKSQLNTSNNINKNKLQDKIKIVEYKIEIERIKELISNLQRHT